MSAVYFSGGISCGRERGGQFWNDRRQAQRLWKEVQRHIYKYHPHSYSLLLELELDRPPLSPAPKFVVPSPIFNHSSFPSYLCLHFCFKLLLLSSLCVYFSAVFLFGEMQHHFKSCVSKTCFNCQIQMCAIASICLCFLLFSGWIIMSINGLPSIAFLLNINKYYCG